MIPRKPDQTLDEYLVMACRDGQQEAFASLYARWQPKLLAHAGQLLGRGQHDRVGDVCQEAWLAIARRIASLEDPRLFRAWAYSIVTRRVADLRRRLGREQRAGRELEARSDSLNQSGESGDQSDQQHALQSALHKLSSEDRALLRLFYLDELSVVETAAALGIPVGTVKSRLFHVRQRLRRTMQRMES